MTLHICPRRATTLTGVLLGMMVATLLFGGAYRVVKLQLIGTHRARLANQALFILESSRNQIIRESASWSWPVQAGDIEIFLRKLFPGFRLVVREVSILSRTRQCFRLHLVFPVSPWGGQLSFHREVTVP